MSTSQVCGLVFFALLGWLWWWCRRNPTPTARGVGARYQPARASAGPCGVCGTYSTMLASHEAGHVAAAQALGYRVTGAVVRRNGTGVTLIPGWTRNPWHTMVIAAAGASGENRDRWTDAGLNGSPSAEGSDAWWVHRLAPVVGRQRGMTKAQVIASARAQADRLVAANAGVWRQTKTVLREQGRIGDAT